METRKKIVVPEREVTVTEYACDIYDVLVKKRSNLKNCKFCGRDICPHHTITLYYDNGGFDYGDHPEYCCTNINEILKKYIPEFKKIEKEYDKKVETLRKKRLTEMINGAQS